MLGDKDSISICINLFKLILFLRCIIWGITRAGENKFNKYQTDFPRRGKMNTATACLPHQARMDGYSQYETNISCYRKPLSFQTKSSYSIYTWQSRDYNEHCPENIQEGEESLELAQVNDCCRTVLHTEQNIFMFMPFVLKSDSSAVTYSIPWLG